MEFLGEAKPSPKSASRKNEPHSYLLDAQSSWEGSWEGLALPQEIVCTYLGEGKPFPDPPKSASRKNEPHSYLLGAHRSWEGSGKGLVHFL